MKIPFILLLKRQLGLVEFWYFLLKLVEFFELKEFIERLKDLYNQLTLKVKPCVSGVRVNRPEEFSSLASGTTNISLPNQMMS